MTRFIALLISIFVAQPSFAEQDIISRDEMLLLAREGNFAGLETAFREIHQANIAGDISADELRISVAWLTLADPIVLDTSERWLAEMPDSPYAAITVAWQLYSLAWSLRGGAPAALTYPDALTEFAGMHYDALQLTHHAYDLAPDYLAVTDAYLRLQKSTKYFDGQGLEGLIEKVMREQPNPGTLVRAADLSDVRWGGGGGATITRLCDLFGKYLAEAQPDYIGFFLTEENCVSHLTIMSDVTDASFLTAIYDPIVYAADARRSVRFRAILERRDQSKIQEVVDYLWSDTEKSLGDIELATKYHGYFDIPNDEQDLLNAHIAKSVLGWAPSALTESPFDLGLLGLLEGGHTPWYEGSPYWKYSDKAVIIYARRALLSPYDGVAWSKLARENPGAYQLIQPSVVENMFANALSYSLYAPHVVRDFVVTRSNAHEALKMGTSLSKQLGRELDVDAQDAANFVYCPMVRIDRLQSLMCEADPWTYAAQCDNVANPFSDRLELLETAATFGLCHAERTGTWENLVHWPVEVDLSPYIDYEFPEPAHADTF